MPSKISKTKLEHSWQFNAIGTVWSIETTRELPLKIKKQIYKCIDEFDSIYSRFRNDSVVSHMSKRSGTFVLGNDSEKLSRFYRQLYDVTNGSLTPFIGGGLVAAGYDKDYSLIPNAPLLAPLWNDDFVWIGDKIITKQPVVLDVGAAGKGLLVDKVANILEAGGIFQYLIDASGDIKHKGSETQIIGLENPYDIKKVVGIYSLRNASLCASASNRRKWAEGWHHLLDGRTGKPTNDVIATWVVSSDTMIADGLATALFFINAETLSMITDFQSIRLLADGKIEQSKLFVGQLYI